MEFFATNLDADQGSKERRALVAMVLTPAVRDWLAENDPAALRQAQQALNGRDYTEYGVQK